MHFIDHVDFVASSRRRVLCRLEQLPHLVYASVGGRIDFQQVHETPAVDLNAGRALATGVRGDARLAVETFGEYPRKRRLPDASSSRQQIRMVETLAFKGMAQRANNVLLPYQA